MWKQASLNLLRRFDEVSASIPHYGEQAVERESFLVDELNRRIPTRFRARRGFVSSVSTQIDTLIYDSANFGTSRQLSNTIVAPESVVTAIMETRTLSAGKLREDLEKLARIKTAVLKAKKPLRISGSTWPLGIIVAFELADSVESIHKAYHEHTCAALSGNADSSDRIDFVMILRDGWLLSLAMVRPGEEAPIILLSHNLTELAGQLSPGTKIFTERSRYELATGEIMFRWLIEHLQQSHTPNPFKTTGVYRETDIPGATENDGKLVAIIGQKRDVEKRSLPTEADLKRASKPAKKS